jgi:hypothetical protein
VQVLIFAGKQLIFKDIATIIIIFIVIADIVKILVHYSFYNGSCLSCQLLAYEFCSCKGDLPAVNLFALSPNLAFGLMSPQVHIVEN